MTDFGQLNLRPTTLKAVEALGFQAATDIQTKAIPELIAGRDLIAQARTGTGKTAAFGIPLVERLGEKTMRGVHGLVLVPTRELCLQVTEQLVKLARGTRLRFVPIYGGVGFGRQTEDLRSHDPIVVVATPGRLLDHLQRGSFKLDDARMLILDEADRMLDMGFWPDVQRIMQLLPRERQTAMFSATVPDPIRQMSQRFLRNPVTVRVEEGPQATPNAEQFRIDLQRSQKTQGLLALFKKEDPESAIVFTRTKHLARRLAQQLDRSGFRAVALQGNMSQPQRERAMESFREAEVRILVATDIASRGLDVPHVSHVVNYDVPMEPEAYVHRIGRTARMGRTGRAFTFVQGDQLRDLAAIERTAGIKLERFDVGELPPPPPEVPRGNEREDPRGPRNYGDRSQGRARTGHGGGNRYQGGRQGGGRPQGGNRRFRDNTQPQSRREEPRQAPAANGFARGSDSWA